MAGEAVSESADVETSLPIGLGPDMAKNYDTRRGDNAPNVRRGAGAGSWSHLRLSNGYGCRRQRSAIVQRIIAM